MDRTSRVELTNYCLIYQDDKILVEEKNWKGTKGIVFPGGHVEEGESLRDSVIREMKEETGLTIENPVLCGVKDWMEEDGSRYMVLLYKTNQFSGTLKSSEEGRVFWVTREQFEQMEVMWHLKEVLSVMDSGKDSELFWIEEQQEWQIL